MADKSTATDAQIAQALRMSFNVRSHAAKALGIDTHRVCKYAEDHRIPPAWIQHPAAKNSKESQILKALAENGNDRAKSATAIGANIKTVERWGRYHNIPLPPRVKVPRKVSELPLVKWDEGNLAKLRRLYMRDPRPTAEELAVEFNSTASAIQTVLSRKGITRNAAITGANWKNEKKPHGCLICRMPFLSEGSHNRQCPSCYQINTEIAA